jgi:hypothetical protein
MTFSWFSSGVFLFMVWPGVQLKISPHWPPSFFFYIYFLLLFFVYLFTCAYIVWVISPPCPPPLLSFKLVPFCPCDWFYWRKDISIIRKTKRFC